MCGFYGVLLIYSYSVFYLIICRMAPSTVYSKASNDTSCNFFCIDNAILDFVAEKNHSIYRHSAIFSASMQCCGKLSATIFGNFVLTTKSLKCIVNARKIAASIVGLTVSCINCKRPVSSSYENRSKQYLQVKLCNHITCFRP